VKRLASTAAITVLIGVAGWQGASAFQTAQDNVAEGESPAADQPDTTAPAGPTAPKTADTKAPGDKPQPPVATETPMAERVATLGFLNKRNGISRDLVLHPGQAVRIGDAIVRLRACETTADWEPEQLTGAFVQLDVRGRDQQWRRNFSGWLYKESPSLNVVPSALYDVWPKACTMRHPDMGPDTVPVSAGAPARSSAKKSTGDGPEGNRPAAPTPPAAKAASSNPT